MADIGTGNGSPSHPQSELSTNPNTPRTESPEPEPIHPVDAPGLEASPDSSTSGDNRYDIQPTWPKMIDLTKASAVATWKDHRLSDLFLDLHWHTPSNKAFFKLRAIIPLSRVPGRRDGKTSVYVFIHPERIRQLSVELVSSETILGPEAVSLKFELDRPPVLVVPNTPYEPKNTAAKQFLEAFRAFASQSCFDVHAEIPRRKLSATRLQELCAVVSGQDVASLTAHANAARLYQGRGGQIIEGSTLIESHAPPEPDEPPPQYCEPPAASSPKICEYTSTQSVQRRSIRLSTYRPRSKAPPSSQLRLQHREASRTNDPRGHAKSTRYELFLV